MHPTRIDPVLDPRWDRFVGDHPYGSIFHTSAWCKTLTKTFGYAPCCIVIEHENTIRAGMLFMMIKSPLTGNRLVSLPRTSYCDPLTEDEADLANLLDHSIEILHETNCAYVEFRTQQNTSMAASPRLAKYSYFSNHTLRLAEGSDALWKNFHRTCVKQRITRARKSNVEVKFSDNREDLRHFHRLHVRSSWKNRVPPRPFKFFTAMWDELHPKGHMLLALAEVGSRPAAAALLLKSGSSLIFEFLGLNYRLIQYSPGHLLTWHAIQYAVENGFGTFDFGVTNPANGGLLDFKRRWGADHRKLDYYYFPDVSGYKNFIRQPKEEKRQTRTERILAPVKLLLARALYRHLG